MIVVKLLVLLMVDDGGMLRVFGMAPSLIAQPTPSTIAITAQNQESVIRTRFRQSSWTNSSRIGPCGCNEHWTLDSIERTWREASFHSSDSSQVGNSKWTIWALFKVSLSLFSYSTEFHLFVLICCACLNSRLGFICSIIFPWLAISSSSQRKTRLVSFDFLFNNAKQNRTDPGSRSPGQT